MKIHFPPEKDIYRFLFSHRNSFPIYLDDRKLIEKISYVFSMSEMHFENIRIFTKITVLSFYCKKVDFRQYENSNLTAWIKTSNELLISLEDLALQILAYEDSVAKSKL